MRYGAIDIGSNAVRLMVKEIREEAGELRSDKVAYTRIPIRLGEDVFETGRISPAKQEALTRAIEAFRLSAESMEVADYLRDQRHAEAENGSDVVAAIRAQTGVDIEVIPRSGGSGLDLLQFLHRALDRIETTQMSGAVPPN